jgi:hypothetical protein
MKTTRFFLTPFALGLLLVGCGGGTSVAPSPVSKPVMVQVPLDGSDVAQALGIRLYRYQIDLEPGWYTTKVWMESWTKGIAAPETAIWSTSQGEIRAGRILLQIPNKQFPEAVFGIDGGLSRGPQLEQFWVDNIPLGGLIVSPENSIRVVLDQDLTLFRATSNANGFGTNSQDFSTHDRAWVVKVRFTREADPNAK